ncbi:tRNA (guanosine(46)-N7)-methyltransferase TrmB [Alicyclobacillus fastidiosus]|uniref:tRNA (guanine-N(7)-)-methyltransferase n=1 Tax=Alicyclobacillus fastidiosus TaxID=392011 RepID=A0ABY6ZDQ1_9BACL|nr:tRNA (guanosine(46)-N7)-methyltransferase TrmB [Alicyclobacillus fastidiosus]WAH40967.1 tRNA (guanosine(46)-N7)-methyltransferase TrmB [Alicyclobacillus fastidiosus]GMA62481.1 tRNA (guanine-N(7)-)-methyltransferase [Alicyclobacillus fastidiosus]
MRYRGAHHLPEWLKQGASVLRDSRKDDLSEVFQAIDQPICIEVGCGKGGFIRQMAERWPDVMFVGIDKVPAVIAKAAANSVEQGLSNVLFIIGDIEHIAPKIEDHRVQQIFLNFSDPWPKARHESRRLTAPQKLQMYARLLAKDGVLEQKTDNLPFFDWSVESIERANWDIERVERGFAANDETPNELSSQFVQTEYEQKFRGQGIPIHYLCARPPAE